MTRRTASPLSMYASWTALREGNSFRQSGHHVFMKLRSRTLPEKSLGEYVFSERSLRAKSGAGSPSSSRRLMSKKALERSPSAPPVCAGKRRIEARTAERSPVPRAEERERSRGMDSFHRKRERRG